MGKVGTHALFLTLVRMLEVFIAKKGASNWFKKYLQLYLQKYHPLPIL